jgi:hypothetical protein
MSWQTWDEVLSSAIGDSTPLTNTVTATSILPAAAKFTLPANFFNRVGQVIRLNLWGRISNAASATLTLDVRLGSVVAFNGGAMTLNATTKSNVSWRAIVMLTCRALGTGTSANLLGQGDFCSEAALGSAAGVANDLMIPASAPAAGTGWDSTVAQTLDVFGTWGGASASNSITTHQYTLEAMN